MSNNDCEPDQNDPGSQHFIEATVNEVGRLGGKADEAFLERVTDELKKLEAEPEASIPVISKQKKSISSRQWTHYGIAAGLVASALLVVLLNHDDENPHAPVFSVVDNSKTIQPVPTIDGGVGGDNPSVPSKPKVDADVEEDAAMVVPTEQPAEPASPEKSPSVDLVNAESEASVDIEKLKQELAEVEVEQTRKLQEVKEVEPENVLIGTGSVRPDLRIKDVAVSEESVLLAGATPPVAKSPIPVMSPRLGAPAASINPDLRRLKPQEIVEEVIPVLPGKKIVGKQTDEKYSQLIDNKFASPLADPLSTFSVDVDTASYSNLRRMIKDGSVIPKDSVRIEEMINYFSYDYPQPKAKHPFALAVETAECPWNTDHQLLRVGIQGRSIDRDKRPDANLVFLIDVSGSMNDSNKLPLVIKSMELLIEELSYNDIISVVVYAGSEGVCLTPTRGNNTAKIATALKRLKAGGSTNGGAGIKLAYKYAKANYIKGGINRVILCSDGDFNVGVTGDDELVSLVKDGAQSGTYLSVLGFGAGNINDAMLEAITNHGNGNYAYIDSLQEGRKVLLQDMMSTLVTIAKDVKVQVEFNPAHVQSYRLIGYANRMLQPEDFNNDQVDAGEVGSGHSVTALYEIVPAGAPPVQLEVTDRLKYQRPPTTAPIGKHMQLVDSDELCTVKLRYKRPAEQRSNLIETPVTYQSREWQRASADYQWAAATSLWGMILRESPYISDASVRLVKELANEGLGSDAFGRRKEMTQLIEEWENR